MNRRGFLKGMGLVLAAPAYIKAENLMGLWLPLERRILCGPQCQRVALGMQGLDWTEETIKNLAATIRNEIDADLLSRIRSEEYE